MHSCSTFDFHDSKVCCCGHFGIAKTCNFSTKCLDDDDGSLHGTRTKGELLEEMLVISKIWKFFRTHAYAIIFRW